MGFFVAITFSVDEERGAVWSVNFSRPPTAYTELLSATMNTSTMNTSASFPGSSLTFCRILYSMQQKAGQEPGNEAGFLSHTI